jgi:hypothetical protein
MTETIAPEGSATPLDRIRPIIVKPREEWPRIAADPLGQNDILTKYVLPLAAIGPIATLIGGQVFGYSALGITWRPPLVGSVLGAIISYALTILAVFVLTFIADFLAPKFEGQSNRLSAFKLVAFGATAAWLAGVFSLIPMLRLFGILGLYSFYLFYTGATPLMKVPEAKAVGFTVVTFLCAFVLMLIVAPITAALTGAFGYGAYNVAANASDGGRVALPGGNSIDLGQMQKMSKRMEDAANGKAPPVAAARLQQLLPTAIGAYQRTATENIGAGPMGSTAQGTYTSGDKNFTLRVADMSALGALAGMGAALGVQQSREDANGYERTSAVNGQMQTESWDNVSHEGKFGTMVANRFLIEAEGNPDSIDQLKAAVATVNADDLADLAD